MANRSDGNSSRRNSREQLWRFTISFICGVFIQVSLLFIPHFFPSLSLLTHFLLSVIVLAISMGICLYVRRLLGIHASAPAFVFFHFIFVWVVFLSVIRQAVSMVLNIVMNAELAILVIGFFRILASDPGFVCHDSSDPGFVCHDSPSLAEDPILEDGHRLEEVSSTETGISLTDPSEGTSSSSRRIRYCRSCKAYVMGFDHHCPAFGNCIGQKNHGLFLLLLVGFVMSEASYVVLSYQWINRNFILKERSSKIYYSLVMSTMNFSLLQVMWQVGFLAWHVYCVCVNIRTEEWINWRKFPEFHVISQPSPDQSFPDMRFRNPYDKGVLCNLKEFLLR